ncbi:MAG: pentapeptide repeat-containing protein [Synechococcus sp.]
MPAIETAVELLDEYAVGVRHFSRSNLRNAYLPEIELVAVNLSWGCLAQAHLVKANLRRANLEWANLVAVDLTDAQLMAAHLNWANLGQACMVGANLNDAQLNWSNLVATDLRATHLNQANLVDAYYSSQTLFPAGFDPALAGMIQVDVNVPSNRSATGTVH